MQKAARYFGYLRNRWEEQKYEDFRDYVDAMKEHLPKGAILKSMTKKPFRVLFVWKGVFRFITANEREVWWGRWEGASEKRRFV